MATHVGLLSWSEFCKPYLKEEQHIANY